MPQLRYQNVRSEAATLDVASYSTLLFALMLRNVATDSYRFSDPTDPIGRHSLAGCVIASPSYPAEEPAIDQNYVYNWTRDAALTAVELAAATNTVALGVEQNLVDYVNFADRCQRNTEVPLTRGCFQIDANPRDWSDQSDGPALRIIAVLAILDRLDSGTRSVAEGVIGRDVDCVLQTYRDPTTSLWEEHRGQSFFARSVQLRALQQIAMTTYASVRSADIAAAVGWLTESLAAHWTGEHYATLLDGDTPAGYDPNADIIMACVYGAVDVLDGRLLKTAAALRAQWTDPVSPYRYPINVDDDSRGIGPLLGRYPQDRYDGDTGDSNSEGRHPWALISCNGAELYYRVAGRLTESAALVVDDLTAGFYQQVGIDAGTPVPAARARLRAAGDRMLQAVLFHSDHFELSEQFDGTTGYQKSVQNLTWSYSAFLSALRARAVTDHL